jgi:hypothetical protein
MQTVEGLLHAMRHQLKLSKEASSALIDLGQTMSESATKNETDILLASTLFQEAHVRNASLQALQVRTYLYFISAFRPDDKNSRLI